MRPLVAVKPPRKAHRPGLTRDWRRVPERPRTRRAVLTLFFGAALIPETVATFNSPPLLLASRPVLYLFLSAFYGSVALLVREYLRRRARWPGVLLLGVTAGAINEGIIAGTWYQVQYQGYALIGGVDVAVAVGLTVFHVLVSTVVPILLAELIFPGLAGSRWLGRTGITVCLILLGLTIVTGLGPPGHRGPKLAVLVGVLFLVALALAWPGRAARREPAGRAISGRPAPGPRILRLAGAAATLLFFSLFTAVPGVVASAVPPAGRGPWQVLLMILMSVFFALVIAVGRRWSARPGWGPRQVLAVITGALLPATVLSVVVPTALLALEPLATLPTLALLIWLDRRLSRPRTTKVPG